MNHETLAHGTLTLNKSFLASPARVFAAWSDPDQRRVWGSPSDEIELAQDEADFSVGGLDVSRCLYEGEVVALVRGRYYDIVPNRRIVYSETIANPSATEGVCLVNAEFLPRGTGTELVLTLQCTALDGADLLQGVREGWDTALANLDRLLQT